MFKKKPPEQPERARRPLQQPVNRSVVFSYHANRTPRAGTASRDIQQEKPVRDHPKRNLSKMAPNILIAGGLLVLFVFSLQLSPAVSVKTTQGSDDNVFLRDQSVYEDALSDEFKKVLNRNKLTVNTDQIATALVKQFPEIEAASVSLPFLGNRPTVYIQPSQPTLILSTQSNGLYVLDSAGRALIAGNQVPSLSKLDLPVVTDESGLAITVGKVALPRNTVRFIHEMVFQLRQKDMVITSLTLPSGTSELHLRVDGAGYYVKCNLYGNAREEAGAFIALRERFGNSSKAPKEYVDVRVEGRVYYK